MRITKDDKKNMKLLNRTELKMWLVKLVSTLDISEIGYLATKFLSTYIFLTHIDLTSPQISITTTIVAGIVYLAAANIMLKRTKFFMN